MDNIRINVAFRNTKKHFDSEKRSEHVFERMKLRGIGRDQIKDALNKGAKRLRSDGSIVAEYRWFKVIYREFRIKGMRKVYPITVIDI